MAIKNGAIPISKYVKIVSSISKVDTVTDKEMIARLFSSATKLPVNGIYEFTSANDVLDFFGSDSTEYQLANLYFNFVSKYLTSPKKISFARDCRGGVLSFVYGIVKPTLSTIKAVTDGSMSITLKGEKLTLTGADFSAATSFADCAAILQTKIRALSEETQWTQATVVYNVADSVFVITAGTAVDVCNLTEIVAGPTGTDISVLFGINTNTQNPIISQGVSSGDATVTNIFVQNYKISNNFGNFAFIGSCSTSEITELSALINNSYKTDVMYVQGVNNSNYSAITSAIKTACTGTSLELTDSVEGPYNYIIPMAIMASTDYDKTNGTQLYMYNQMDGINSLVGADDYEDYDNKKINYYGMTQKAGKDLSFYQDGVMQGDISDQSIYANEIWLKDALATVYLNYFLVNPRWAANLTGKGIGIGIAQEVILRAKNNGTITTEKEFSSIEKASIATMTGDQNAWQQIYSQGYYLTASITKDTTDLTNIKYIFNYILVYSKGDSIRKVEGQNILI